MTMDSYRPELPEVPERMRSLPIRRGYPVPWFVAMVDGDYHFPTADGRKLTEALRFDKCWVCGQKITTFKSFVIGPMCAVNRNTSEPPCHLECAVFSAKACPFLTRPHMKRVQDHPEGSQEPPGIYLTRNPGVTCVWTCRDYLIRRMENGYLFRIGVPTKVQWFAEGRVATREEVLHSIDTGMPLLREVAERDGDWALKELATAHHTAMKLVPQ